MKTLKALKNQRGFLTLDLIFAFSLIFGVMLITIALSTTLVAIEVAQYVAFSTSRAYYGANATPEAQASKAQQKYDELMAINKLGGFLKSDWFRPSFNGAREYGEYKPDAQSGVTFNPFWGTEIKLNVKILGFKVPFFGSTTVENAEGFMTSVNSFLGREPSDQECRAFQSRRWEEIRRAHDNSSITSAGFQPPVIMDNGC